MCNTLVVDKKPDCYVKSLGNVLLYIHKEKGLIWLKAVIKFGGYENRIEEFLVCEDVDQGIFHLTSRVSHGVIPITTIARRHFRYPLDSRVRLDVK